MNYNEDLFEHKIKLIENSSNYGIFKLYPIIAWTIIPIHLIGLFFELWDLSTIPFATFFLYETIMIVYNNILMRIEINTLDLQRDMRLIKKDLEAEFKSQQVLGEKYEP